MQSYPPISELPEAVTLAIEIIKASAVAARIKEFAKSLYTVEGVILSVVPGEPDGLPKQARVTLEAELNRLGPVLGDVIDDELPKASAEFNPLWVIALIQAILKLIDLFKADNLPTHNQD